MNHMKTIDRLSFVTTPLDVLIEYRYVSWTISVCTLVWVIAIKYGATSKYYHLVTILWWLTVLMGLVEVLCHVGWFLLFPKDHLGLPFVGSVLTSLPIVIPAVLILLFRPK